MQDPAENLIDLTDLLFPLNLSEKQSKDETLEEVIKWKNEYQIPDLTYASFELEKIQNNMEAYSAK